MSIPARRTTLTRMSIYVWQQDFWSHKELVQVDCSENGEVLSIAYFKDKIFSGHSDGTIKVMVPTSLVRTVFVNLFMEKCTHAYVQAVQPIKITRSISHSILNMIIFHMYVTSTEITCLPACMHSRHNLSNVRIIRSHESLYAPLRYCFSFIFNGGIAEFMPTGIIRAVEDISDLTDPICSSRYSFLHLEWSWKKQASMFL